MNDICLYECHFYNSEMKSVVPYYIITIDSVCKHDVL